MSIETMKQAIDFAEYCLEELDLSYMASNQAKRLIEKSRQAIAEAEKKDPVAGVVVREGLPTLLRDSDIKPTDKRLYTQPPQSEARGLSQPAPTDKPKAVSETHKPLTEMQIIEATEHIDESRSGYFIHIARAIEAAHGIKE